MNSEYRNLLLYSNGIKIISPDSNRFADKRLSKLIKAYSAGPRTVVMGTMRNKSSVLEYLSERGINLNHRDNTGCVHLIELFNNTYESAETVEDELGILQRCVSLIGDFTVRDGHNNTVLSTYLRTNGCRKEIVEFMLDHGADPSVLNDSGDDALGTYILNGGSDREIMNMIVDHLPRGIPLYISMRKYLAVELPEENAISLIIDKGHNVSTVYNDKTTDLLRYVNNRDYPINSNVVRMFLERGSNAHHEDKNGYTPLMGCLVRFRRHSDLPKYSLYDRKRVADNDKKLDEIVKSINLLLDHGAKVTTKSHRYGWTPLQMACTRHSNEAMIRRMVSLGADVTIANHRGYTPLMRYCVLKTIDIDIIKLFLSKGADPDTKNADNGASSFLRFTRRMKINHDILRVFLRRGCDIYVQDFRGKGCLQNLEKRVGKNWRSMMSESNDLRMCRNRLTIESEFPSDVFSRFVVNCIDDLFYSVCKFL